MLFLAAPLKNSPTKLFNHSISVTELPRNTDIKSLRLNTVGFITYNKY